MGLPCAALIHKAYSRCCWLPAQHTSAGLSCSACRLSLGRPPAAQAGSSRSPQPQSGCSQLAGSRLHRHQAHHRCSQSLQLRSCGTLALHSRAGVRVATPVLLRPAEGCSRGSVSLPGRPLKQRSACRSSLQHWLATSLCCLPCACQPGHCHCRTLPAPRALHRCGCAMRGQC